MGNHHSRFEEVDGEYLARPSTDLRSQAIPSKRNLEAKKAGHSHHLDALTIESQARKAVKSLRSGQVKAFFKAYRTALQAHSQKQLLKWEKESASSAQRSSCERFIHTYSRVADGLSDLPFTKNQSGKRKRFGLTSLIRIVPYIGPTLVIVLSILLYIIIPWMLSTPFWMRLEILSKIAEAWLKGVIIPIPPFNAWWAATVEPDKEACELMLDWIRLRAVVQQGSHVGGEELRTIFDAHGVTDKHGRVLDWSIPKSFSL